MPVEPSSTRFVKAPRNSFVLPEHKVVYVWTAGVAGTSLRWMLADLAGEDLDRLRAGAGGSRSGPTAIDRRLLQRITRLDRLTPEQLGEITPENGWFVFGLLRDPWSRLWSAWQSTFLVRRPRYRARFAEAPYFPRVPARAADVVEDFARFVELHPWTTEPTLRRDHHFHTQVRRLKPDQVPYTRVYDVGDLATFTADLHAHLRRVGRDRQLALPTIGATPLPLTREVLGGGVLEAIEELYKEDFDAYGHRWDPGSLELAPDGWNRDAIAHAAYHTVANDWIDQVTRTGRQWRHERDEMRRRQRAAREKLRRAHARAQRLKAQNQRLRAAGARPLVRRVAAAARTPRATLSRLLRRG